MSDFFILCAISFVIGVPVFTLSWDKEHQAEKDNQGNILVPRKQPWVFSLIAGIFTAFITSFFLGLIGLIFYCSLGDGWKLLLILTYISFIFLFIYVWNKIVDRKNVNKKL